jgi:hypothetical protein
MGTLYQKICSNYGAIRKYGKINQGVENRVRERERYFPI